VELRDDLQEAGLVLVQSVQPDDERVPLGRVVAGRDVDVDVAPLAEGRGVDAVVRSVVGGVVVHPAGELGVQLADVGHPATAAALTAECGSVRGGRQGNDEGEGQRDPVGSSGVRNRHGADSDVGRNVPRLWYGESGCATRESRETWGRKPVIAERPAPTVQ